MWQFFLESLIVSSKNLFYTGLGQLLSCADIYTYKILSKSKTKYFFLSLSFSLLNTTLAYAIISALESL